MGIYLPAKPARPPDLIHITTTHACWAAKGRSIVGVAALED